MTKIKGNALLSRMAFVKEQYGEGAWQEVLGRLTKEDRATIERTLAPAGWYPFEMGERLEKAIVDVVGKGDIRIFERMGAMSAKTSLTGVHKHFLQPRDPQAFLSKAGVLYHLYYDKGRREYESTGPHSATLTTYDAEQYSEADCHTVIGYQREALTMCGARDIVITEESCRAKGAPFCRLKISWK